MTTQEFSALISLIKDVVLTIGAIITIFLGLYGLKIWKRDLIGKEAYTVVSAVVKNLHKASKALQNFRKPVQESERRAFTQQERENFTENERWSMLEREVFAARAEKLETILNEYSESVLSARVLLGSSVSAATLEFNGIITDHFNCVNEYLELIRDQNLALGPDSPQTVVAQQATFITRDLDDTLTIKLYDAREATEKAFLRYLHRNDIRGKVLKKRETKSALAKWRASHEERRARAILRDEA
jgi:hypothetical protein